MKVADIMTKDVISISENTSLKEAAGLLAKVKIHGMPVVDSSKKVIGIITESDFFAKDSSNIFLPTFIDFLEKGRTNPAVENNPDEAVLKSTVKDIMTQKCDTVKGDLSVKELIRLFKDKTYNSLPVVDDNGFLVGIVTIMDIIKLL